MNGPAPECPACRVVMESGSVLTSDKNGRLKPLSWIEGPLEPGGMYGYRIKGKRQVPSVTWRCPRCGWLLWFAPDPEPESDKGS
jgi:hypothetical protein